jgi:hypothetical protein
MTKAPVEFRCFDAIAGELLAAGLTLPPPIQAALDGQPIPLSLGTREQLPAWCAAHAYSPEQTDLLNRAISRLVTSPDYRRALSADLAVRVNLDGEPDGRVDRIDRHSAALSLVEFALKKANLPAGHQASRQHHDGRRPAAAAGSVSTVIAPTIAGVLASVTSSLAGPGKRPPAASKELRRAKLSLPSSKSASPVATSGLSPEEQAKRLRALRSAMRVVTEGR